MGVFTSRPMQAPEPEPSNGKTPIVASSAFLNPPALTQVTAIPYSTPRALTAAAAQIKMKDVAEFEQFRARRNAASSQWQAEAWEYYDAIGEIKYAFNLVASVVSRIRIYAATFDEPSEAPIAVASSTQIDPRLAAAAERALSNLNSAYGGQAGLIRDAALNLSVVGEFYLIQMPERKGTGTPESWDVRSTDELIADQRGNYSVIGRREQGATSGSGANSISRGIPLSERAFVGRVWRTHPRYSDEADSSLRGLLDLCAELLLLNRTFRATARSRLNAGALYLPDGLSVAAQSDGDYPMDSDIEIDPTAYTAEEAEDEFEEALMDAMTTPIRDEESAAAVVPLIIRGPAELGDKIKQFKFERSFDDALIGRADRVLERILQGLDVPKDVVTGMASVKYSNALQIDESLYKAHIEPLMLLIVDSLTVVYLRPYLIASGFDPVEVAKLVVWYDPSAVATRNDRAEDADNGFDRGAISYETWRRAHGFSEADAPTGNEVALRMVSERGQITPEMTEAVMGALAPEILDAVRDTQQANSVAPIPPAVDDILEGAPAAPGAPGAPEPAADGGMTPVPPVPEEAPPALYEPPAKPAGAP